MDKIIEAFLKAKKQLEGDDIDRLGWMIAEGIRQVTGYLKDPDPEPDEGPQPPDPIPQPEAPQRFGPFSEKPPAEYGAFRHCIVCQATQVNREDPVNCPACDKSPARYCLYHEGVADGWRAAGEAMQKALKG